MERFDEPSLTTYPSSESVMSFRQQYLLAIVGPTASGKTALALHIARRIGGEILSADSRQIYKRLTIGTAKPTEEERACVKHHFIDILDPSEEYSAGLFGIQARACIAELFQKKIQPLLVGGSGLYVKAVIDGLFEEGTKSTDIRRQLQQELEEHGGLFLYRKLQEVDPEAAARMDETKVRRILRALEVYYTTGKPISYQHRTQHTHAPFRTCQIGLEWQRSKLYERINRRVEKMIGEGLIDEVRSLQNDGYSPALNSLNTVGYKEVFQYLRQEISFNTMVALIKQNTRRFAKRQLTWFRADKRIHWLKVENENCWEELASGALQYFAQWCQEQETSN